MPQAKRAKRRPKRVKRVLNVVPSRGTERDWQLEQADAAGLIARAAALPASKDLRETWWKVGDQRSTGSCVGWATADALLRLCRDRELRERLGAAGRVRSRHRHDATAVNAAYRRLYETLAG